MASCGPGSLGGKLFFGLGQRLLQALQPHGFGQVIASLHVKSLGRIVAVGGDKNNRWWRWQLLQSKGKAHAIGTGHLDVQQHNVHRQRAGQKGQRLAGAGRFAHRPVLTVGGAIAQQVAQAAAGQGFVVNDQDVHGQWLRRGCG